MKGLFAWIIFGLAAATCLVWVFLGARDDLREADVFQHVAEERVARAEAKEGIVRIGVTGNLAAYPDMENGILLAAREINAAGGLLGRTVELVIRDDEDSSDTAMSIAQAFSMDTAMPFVVGHTSLIVNSDVAPGYAFYGVLSISPNTADNKGHGTDVPLCFENGIPLKQAAEAILDFAKQHGWQRLGLIYAADEFSKQQARRFESMATKRGLNIPLSYGYGGPGYDLSTHMEQWKRELDLDAVILAVEDEDRAQLANACREHGVHQPLIVAAELAGESPACPGEVYYLVPPGNSEAANDMAVRFKDAFGHAPRADALYGYDALHILAQGVSRAGSLVPASVARALLDHPVQGSLTGTIRFDRHGTAVKQPSRFVTH